MPGTLARVVLRTMLFALLLTCLLPVISTAQEPADEDEEPVPGIEVPAPESLTPTPTMQARPTASPSPTPRLAQPLPSRDWRSVGYASVVEGKLYDPYCRPLRSVGSNVPNMMFRDGLRDNLEWMRAHQIRWMRVIATGHGTLRPAEQIEISNVERRLAELLREVESFNATHAPQESIYVLVNFTDYYEPGVPGDQYGFDHEGWCNAKVLNAPWYRRGVPRYSFSQECGGGRLSNAPNYEVNYKPWVERLVAIGARSPALLGWQLGNEMKSRDSLPNDIEDAFEWYVDWTADMTDTIRRIDRNHLIVTGTQYLAELTDWAYRPNDGPPDRGKVDGYHHRFDQILRGCATHCWNVWSLTNYDFHHYSIDDAMYLQPLSVPVLVTEYGFTLGTQEEEQQRFGGDRVMALKYGRPKSWVDLTGVTRPYDWSTVDLVNATGIQGIAPWGSPAPASDAHPWYDLDWARGISLAREGDVLWQVWREIANNLESTNNQHGVSAACSAFVSE